MRKNKGKGERKASNLQSQNNLRIIRHHAFELQAGAVPIVLLANSLMARKLHMRRLPIPNIHAGLVQDILEPWPLPRTVHDRPVVPTNALHFLHKISHGVSAIARAGQSADDFMLMKVASDLVDGEEQWSFDGAVDEHDVILGIDGWDFAVVSIVAALFSDEAVGNRMKLAVEIVLRSHSGEKEARNTSPLCFLSAVRQQTRILFVTEAKKSMKNRPRS